MPKITYFSLITALLVSGPGCASRSPEIRSPSGPSQETGESLAEELEIGKQIHAEIMANFYAYTDQRVMGYVKGIGYSLARHAERKQLPYQFIILYNDEIYATSAPGGFVYVTTGMINFLQNESELAAVMAHEIGQLQRRDPKLSSSRKVLRTITQSGTMIAPVFGQIGMLAALGLTLMNVAVESRSESPESYIHQADEKAMIYMTEAGYDPQGLIDVLYRFLNSDQERLPYFYDYYQSRPITEDRFEYLQESFQGLPLTDKAFNTNRENFLQMTKGIREIYKN